MSGADDERPELTIVQGGLERTSQPTTPRRKPPPGKPGAGPKRLPAHYSGSFYKAVPSLWPSYIELVHAVGRPLTLDEAINDLRWWENGVWCGREERVPGYRRLMKRWGWGQKQVRRLMRRTDLWSIATDPEAATEADPRPSDAPRKAQTDAPATHPRRTRDAPADVISGTSVPEPTHQRRTHDAPATIRAVDKENKRGRKQDDDRLGLYDPDRSDVRCPVASPPDPPPSGASDKGHQQQGPAAPAAPSWEAQAVEAVVEAYSRNGRRVRASNTTVKAIRRIGARNKAVHRHARWKAGGCVGKEPPLPALNKPVQPSHLALLVDWALSSPDWYAEHLRSGNWTLPVSLFGPDNLAKKLNAAVDWRQRGQPTEAEKPAAVKVDEEVVAYHAEQLCCRGRSYFDDLGEAGLVLWDAIEAAPNLSAAEFAPHADVGYLTRRLGALVRADAALRSALEAG